LGLVAKTTLAVLATAEDGQVLYQGALPPDEVRFIPRWTKVSIATLNPESLEVEISQRRFPIGASSTGPFWNKVTVESPKIIKKEAKTPRASTHGSEGLISLIGLVSHVPQEVSVKNERGEEVFSGRIFPEMPVFLPRKRLRVKASFNEFLLVEVEGRQFPSPVKGVGEFDVSPP